MYCIVVLNSASFFLYSYHDVAAWGMLQSLAGSAVLAVGLVEEHFVFSRELLQAGNIDGMQMGLIEDDHFQIHHENDDPLNSVHLRVSIANVCIA